MINLNDIAPISAVKRKQLQVDAKNVKATAVRKGTTLDRYEEKEEAAVARDYFELGCWLDYYRSPIGLEGEAGLKARIECALRLILSGINNPHYKFFTVFNFGERDFDTIFEMGDADVVITALRQEIAKDTTGNLVKAFHYYGWPLEKLKAA